MTETDKRQKMIIGSEEWCTLPQLNIPAIKARVDSGAKTSSLHAFNIHPFTRDSENWVSFEIHPVQKNRKIVTKCEARIKDRRPVKSSSGDTENRFVIISLLKLNNFSSEIEITLTNRDSMGYRMLLGREAMIGKIIVDPAESFLTRKISDKDALSFYPVPEKSKDSLTIGLLASNPDLYSNKRIIEAGEIRGHNMIFLNIKHCYMKLDAVTPQVHSRGGKILNHIDAVIPRIRPNITFYGCALTRLFESIGAFCLNNAESITQSRDKLHSLQLMLSGGINIPTTGFAHSPLDTNDLINMVGGSPLIVKLLEGAQGRGVVLAETKKAGESVINAFKSLNANILVQEFIKEAGGCDIRCFVINGKVVASIKRKAAPDDFRANIHQGGSASNIKITLEERRLAVKAAKIFNLQVAGVDIIRSQKGPLVLEVNSSPGLEAIENTSGKDIASQMIQAIEKKLSWKHPSI